MHNPIQAVIVHVARLFVLAVAAYCPLFAQAPIPVEGVVVSKTTGEPVAAASVRVQGTNKGTYTGRDGAFRLPLAPGERFTLLVRSIGYQTAEVVVNTGAEGESVTRNNQSFRSLRIDLVPASVKLGTVNVVAEVSPVEIIRRAIARKDANRRKVSTSSSLVYTKMSFDMRLPTLLLSADQKKQMQAMSTMQAETFSRVQKQFTPSAYTRRTILKRRQTANLPAAANLIVMDEFFDFYDPELNLVGTRLQSPLAPTAPDTYNYRLVERKDFGSRTVYTLAFAPKSPVIPGFEGTVQIIEGSYSIVEITARPTEKTAIQFVNELTFHQKFDRFRTKNTASAGLNTNDKDNDNDNDKDNDNDNDNDDDAAEVWMPTLLEVTGGMQVDVIKWVADVGAKIKVRSIITDVEVNGVLPPNTIPNDSARAALAKKAAEERKKMQSGFAGSASTTRRRSARLRTSPKAARTNTTDTTLAATNAGDSSNASIVAGEPREVVSSESEDNTFAVMSDADSAKAEFWKANALTQLTKDEEETYRQVDSLMEAVRRDTTRRRSGFGGGTSQQSRVNQLAIAEFRLSSTAVLNLNPVFDRTRVSDYLLGATAQVQWDPSDNFGALLVASGAANPRYGVPVGSVGLQADVLRTEDLSLSVAGDVHSRLGALQRRTSLGERLSVLNLNNLLYQNALDFYRENGITAGLIATTGAFTASAEVQAYSISLVPTVVENERGNLPALVGNYEAVQADIAWNLATADDLFQFASFTSTVETSVGAHLTGRVGRERTTNLDFYSVEGRVQWIQPTFYTGYKPMFLRLTVNAGYASPGAPVQEQFIAVRRFGFGGRPTDFATIPLNGIMGTEYVSLHLEHNFSDMLWRWIGLPTWKGRGLEFVLLAQTGRYNQLGTQRTQTVGQIPSEFGEQAFAPTTAWHTELGVGISRIPSFISDLLNFRVDLLWGVGANTLPGNNFGYSVSFSVPF
jgi:Family of unknown function (DUF5686)/CarboxypepD_reg-like domain